MSFRGAKRRGNLLVLHTNLQASTRRIPEGELTRRAREATLIMASAQKKACCKHAAGLLRIQGNQTGRLPFRRKGRTRSSRDLRSMSISSRVVSRLMDTRKAPSMTSPGSFMAVSTWLR